MLALPERWVLVWAVLVLEVVSESTIETISLAGASAALRYIDAMQRRADTVTAVVAKGAKPARTDASLACSKDADTKNIHGKPRKKFMSDCKKAGGPK